jgi:hypothetical protein
MAPQILIPAIAVFVATARPRQAWKTLLERMESMNVASGACVVTACPESQLFRVMIVTTCRLPETRWEDRESSVAVEMKTSPLVPSQVRHDPR